MKTLIVKVNAILPSERQKEIARGIGEGLKLGCIVLNNFVTYEIVEHDSLIFDSRVSKDYIKSNLAKKIEDRNEFINKIREARKKVKENKDD